MDLQFLSNYKDKLVGVEYNTGEKVLFAKGILREIHPDKIILETFNNVIFITRESITKIKVEKENNYD